MFFKFVKYCSARNMENTNFSDRKLENSEFWTLGDFPVTLCCNAHEKMHNHLLVFGQILDPV